MACLSRARSIRRWGVALVGTVMIQCLSLVEVVPSAGAQASEPRREVKRPDYQVLRYNEDWSVLKGVDLNKTDDFGDRLKFIPLTTDQSVWLSVGGQVRERAEYYRQFLFGDSEPKRSDAYLLSRLRLSADLHVTPYVRVFVEGKSAFALDRELAGGRTTTFVDELDLQNGFADIMIPLGNGFSVTLRGGRQE